MSRMMSAKRERFCQLIAADTLNHYECIISAGYDATIPSACAMATEMLKQPDIILRIQELRRPVLRKVRKEFAYNLQKALAQADEAYELAFAQANPAAMLKAIELQSKLVKILSEQVEHRHGLLDDASTAVLLEMKAQIELRKSKRLEMVAQAVLVEKSGSSDTPHEPLLAEVDLVPSPQVVEGVGR